MESGQIEKALCEFIRRELVAPEVNIEAATPLDSVGLDSFSYIEIILFIERKFGIQLPDTALTKSNLYSVATITKCVLDHAAGIRS